MGKYEKYIDAGVKFVNPDHAYIDDEVEIGEGTLIGPCVTLEGKVKIGKNCIIGQNCRIVASDIGDSTEVQQSVLIESKIGKDCQVGPFAYIRPNSVIGNKVKIGDFVEVKNSNIGDGTKASHLTYIGDSDIGKSVNLGCGVIFVNYNGKEKQRSTIEDGVFVGCNVNIISPVLVRKNAYIAAGTTVTRNVPAGALSVGRTKEKILENWVKRKGLEGRE